ncbi:hypothetical protein [Secundilactobacillus kimchicus]|uniref:hypothetical protein n=1 Tax=Secundilactobacillus kimchicus TaxID=528209 RepID=UPI0006D104A8|nr:hypothetical protein [Secundilactobacillus kimchicus]
MAFGIFTVPLTIAFLIGAFVNWLNPINVLFHILVAIAVVGLPALALLVLAAVGTLMIIDFIGFLNPFSVLAGLLLGAGMLLTIGLWVVIILNAANIVAIPMAINLVIWLIVGFVTIFAGEFFSIGSGGILQPGVIGMWVYLHWQVLKVSCWASSQLH